MKRSPHVLAGQSILRLMTTIATTAPAATPAETASVLRVSPRRLRRLYALFRSFGYSPNGKRHSRHAQTLSGKKKA